MSLPHLGSAVGWIINRNEKEIEIKVEKVAAIREMGTQTKFSSLQANIPQMLSKIRFLLFKHWDNFCFCLFIYTKFLLSVGQVALENSKRFAPLLLVEDVEIQFQFGNLHIDLICTQDVVLRSNGENYNGNYQITPTSVTNPPVVTYKEGRLSKILDNQRQDNHQPQW